MLPGVDFTELLLLAVVAMVLLGPRDLPLMMRKVGRFTGKMRAMAFEFKQGFDELGRQAELEELRKEVADLRKHTGIDELQKDFDQDRINLEKDVNSALGPAQTSPETPPPASPQMPSPGTPAPGTPTADDADKPAAAPYAGLSAEHPGYDAGDDFRIEGHGPETPASPDASAETSEPAPEPAPKPAKQDTPV